MNLVGPVFRGEALAATTRVARERGRVPAVVAALAASVALLSAPAAYGNVDGDPIATSTLNLNLTESFQKQLKRNGVKMRPKQITVTSGDVDPTTGAADLRLGKITFKKGHKKVVYRNVKATLPGKVTGSRGKLFRLTTPSVVRNGFGADLSGVEVKFLNHAAKKLNKNFDLHSLHKANAGTLSLSYQPGTVKVLNGEAKVTGVVTPGSVNFKLLAAHCAFAPVPVAPATQSGLTLIFPVTGGTISPAGIDGVVQQAGGIRITNRTLAPCTSAPAGSLLQENFAVNLALQNIQSHVVIEQSDILFTGDKGIVITNLADPAGSTVSADPNAKTVTIDGATIRINQISADTLNQMFPNVSGDPANDFASGDPFGTSNLTVSVR
jgi:hypothetical protein